MYEKRPGVRVQNVPVGLEQLEPTALLGLAALLIGEQAAA
jgi:hypothetical protein